MKYIKMSLSIFLIGVAFYSVFSIDKKSKKIDSSLNGSEKYQSIFQQSVGDAKSFYDLRRRAIEEIKIGNYAEAIKFLNDSLSYVGIGIEKGMVYEDLAEIYRDIDNLDKELNYRLLISKYTMNDRIKLKSNTRAEEIKIILSNPKAIHNLPKRFPEPPIYGRPFNTYREIVIAREASKEYLAKAELLVRDKKYSEAINEFKKAYYPDSSDNGFIESGLIRCYEQLNARKEMITLIDYTLSHNKWAPENVKEFQDLRKRNQGDSQK